MKNTVVWFDIPVKDIDRAMKFYSTVLQVELKLADKENCQYAFFPCQSGEASGALIQSENSTPSDQGSLVYLNGGDDCSAPLSRVEAAGGKVVQDKLEIGEYGFIGYFIDTEGNKVGVHSMG